jgi:hypothetical protein
VDIAKSKNAGVDESYRYKWNAKYDREEDAVLALGQVDPVPDDN